MTDIAKRNHLKVQVEKLKACLIDDRISDKKKCNTQLQQKQNELYELNQKIIHTYSSKKLNLDVSLNSTQDGRTLFTIKLFGEDQCFDFPLVQPIFNSSNVDVRTELSVPAMQFYVKQNHEKVVACRERKGPCNQALAAQYPFVSAPAPTLQYHAPTKSYLIEGVIQDPLGGEHRLRAYIKAGMCRHGKTTVPCLRPLKWESEPTGWLSAGVTLFADISEVVSARANPMFFKINRSQLDIPKAKIIRAFIDESTHNLVYDWKL
jgi:hypothetical protein